MCESGCSTIGWCKGGSAEGHVSYGDGIDSDVKTAPIRKIALLWKTIKLHTKSKKKAPAEAYKVPTGEVGKEKAPNETEKAPADKVDKEKAPDDTDKAPAEKNESARKGRWSKYLHFAVCLWIEGQQDTVIMDWKVNDTQPCISVKFMTKHQASRYRYCQKPVDLNKEAKYNILKLEDAYNKGANENDYCYAAAKRMYDAATKNDALMKKQGGYEAIEMTGACDESINVHVV